MYFSGQEPLHLQVTHHRNSLQLSALTSMLALAAVTFMTVTCIQRHVAMSGVNWSSFASTGKLREEGGKKPDLSFMLWCTD